MKKYIYPLAITATALFATACSDNEVDDIQNIPDSQKEMIEFSMSDGSSQTRAGFTKDNTRIVARFQSDEKGSSNAKYTRTVLKAVKDANGGDAAFSSVSYYTTDNTRYWDDAYGRKGLVSVYAVAIPNCSDDTKLAESKLHGGSTWASETTPNNSIEWGVTISEQTKDAADVTSPTKIIDLEDLVYSNNIQADATLGKDGVYRWDYTEGKHLPVETGAETHKNGRMLFFQYGMTDDNAATTAASSSPGHFDKGHLKFKHALSRITIELEKGEGFASSDPFAFATNTNITLKGMNVKGNLNIKTGEWTVATSGGKDNILKMAQITTGSTNAAGKYMAQMLPDYTFADGNDTSVAEFTIDNNVYYITQNMLFDALTYDANGNGTKDTGDGELVGATSPIKMEQGKNYQFKITVNKKQIESITATLAPWVDVTAADQSMDNSHVQFTFTAPTGTNCTEFQFYRLKEDLTGGITTGSDYTAETFSGDYKTEGAATIEAMGSSGKYQASGWYYDDNQTAYHFRTLNALAADEGGNDTSDKSENITNTADPAKSYFTMTADANLKDYHWGAPMTKDPTAATDPAEAYSPTDGFKECLHKGVTSTTSDLKITEIHMMSEVYVTLKTTTGANKVDLSGAKVTLTQLSIKAKVDMGTGLISPEPQSDAEHWLSVYQNTLTPTTYWASGHDTSKDETGKFSCSVIPQPLVRSTSATPAVHEYVGITIETSDHNKYYVVKELSDLTANSVTGGHTVEEGVAINRWYPGHRYFYTFTITKKGIENITCVLTDWVTVTAGNTNIDLES